MIKLDFIRGHMGGNLIALLHGDQFPPGRELELAVKALGPRYLWAHEAGILYPGRAGADLCVKIAEPTSNCFISACGGMTQVLGKALVEAGLGERYGLPVREPLTRVMLETGAGVTPIEIAVSAGTVSRSVTVMDAFVRECYTRKVRPLELRGVAVMQVGKLLVLNADEVRRIHPEADFAGWDDETRRILTRLQQEFMERTGELEYNIALYDWHPEHEGDLRVVFPHCLPQDFIEPACGTGSVAVGIALQASGELERRLAAAGGRATLRLESGGAADLGGPELTELYLELRGGKVANASFSHSLVEITATGTLRI